MAKAWIDSITSRLSAWQSRYKGALSFMQLAALVIGLLCGIGAAMLKGGVDWVTRMAFSHFDVHAGNFEFLIMPYVGIFLATLITRYVVRHKMDHASERVTAGLENGDVDISPRLILGPIVACSVTLGLGGSAGAEDPIVYTGAAVGSNVGKSFKLPTEQIANLVGCGAGAAIAGIFMAPIGGVMFALEVMRMKQTWATVISLVIASLTAALTCYILLGCHTDVTFVPAMRFDNHLIPWVLLCGLVCGVYSLYYKVMMRKCRSWLSHMPHIWVKAFVGALILSALLFVFPSLYGEGYDVLRRLMVDDPRDVVAYSPLYRLGAHYIWLLVLMVALLLVKPFATSATNDSGGVGGDFTPTFYCGGILGFLFAAALNHYCGMDLPLALFAFFGMAAVMAGAIQAPLMAIFITAEMTGLYGFILPLTLCGVMSFLTTLGLLRLFKGNAPLAEKNS